jgi:hypothetical protein
MSISVQQAKELCTADEFKLAESSWPPYLGSISPGLLRHKIERSRRLQDKFRDLSRRQNRSTKAASSDRTRQANERTAQKAQLFAEVRERFEQRLAGLQD